MRKITEIIIHCTATRPDFMDGAPAATKVREVRKWHLARGWSDVGYHYLIDRDGSVAEGRPIERDGAHVRGRNAGTIGIALFGGHGSSETDLFHDNFTISQNSALKDLISELHEQFGPVPVAGHNEYAAKACPGFNVKTWLSTDGDTQPPEPNESGMATSQERLRWRLREIRDLADNALSGI